jgi:hypothetical protein
MKNAKDPIPTLSRIKEWRRERAETKAKQP